MALSLLNALSITIMARVLTDGRLIHGWFVQGLFFCLKKRVNF